MASIPMDIVEIRRTIYGKAMREPIADACLHLKHKNEGFVIKRLDNVEIRAINPGEDDFRADSEETSDLVLDSLGDNDYLLTDQRETDAVVLIRDTDYSYRLNDSLWVPVIVIGGERNYRLILHY